MNKKATTPIAIVILTIAFFLVIGYAWFSFLTKADEIKLRIQGTSLPEEVYAKESQINFYINSIVQNSAKNSANAQEFVTKFRQELEKYKVNEHYIIPQLEQVETQLSEEKVKIEQDSISISFKIKIDGKLEEDSYELLSIEHIYEKEFSAKPKKISDCRIHFSGLGLSDRSYFDRSDLLAGSSKIWEEDEFSHILTEGEYPNTREALPKIVELHSDGLLPTLDSAAISQNTRLTVYSQQNFQGSVLFNGEGPFVVYNSQFKTDPQFNSEYIDGQWSEPLQSYFPNEKRSFSSQDMQQWESGSLKIEC
jgi:hypothetical protein